MQCLRKSLIRLCLVVITAVPSQTDKMRIPWVYIYFSALRDCLFIAL